MRKHWKIWRSFLQINFSKTKWEWGNKQRERERDKIDKIGAYAFSNRLSSGQWNFIEEGKLRIGDILKISIDVEKTRRFGREKEYYHLIDFKIEEQVINETDEENEIEQLSQEIVELVDELGSVEGEINELKKVKQDISREISRKIEKKNERERILFSQLENDSKKENKDKG
ncbi:MAG: hypothetical protein I3273_00075 [Candidatus Moeniiplasma glomeromycotorum]|nr:hypothetical protein [Candidatus Moeniiplasma glomeromycotorum]MCE8167473.1 hypothetical protein [Candidatus Moeniiplasma glomeromycotorum]MCE8168513.1 hypothetical protein [Candidatus Moeniiplasma glomeromycotorum]